MQGGPRNGRCLLGECREGPFQREPQAREGRPGCPAGPGSGGCPGLSTCLGSCSSSPKPQATYGEHGGPRGADGATWWPCACPNLDHHVDLEVLRDPLPPQASGTPCTHGPVPPGSWGPLWTASRHPVVLGGQPPLGWPRNPARPGAPNPCDSVPCPSPGEDTSKAGQGEAHACTHVCTHGLRTCTHAHADGGSVLTPGPNSWAVKPRAVPLTPEHT